MDGRQRAQAALSYLMFVLAGVNAGVGGVLLPAQMADYGVDRATIGITFFTFSAGFMLAGAVTGPLLHRLGVRWALSAGVAALVAAGLYSALRPPLAGLIMVQLVAGLGVGTVESMLNAHLTTLPRPGVLLGRLHAFFGVGALAGPLVATWTLRSWPWTTLMLVTALPFVPVMAAFVPILPGTRRGGGPVPASGAASGAPATDGAADGRGLLGTVLRQPAVVTAAVFLAVYVGLEISIGNWGYSYLVGERGRSDVAAGNAVSGFWLGLTLGRFVVGPVTDRLRWEFSRTTTVCLGAVTVCSLVVWVTPSAGVAVAGLGVIGFFLGPLFPATMAVTPRITSPHHVPAAIGLLNGVSVIGGSALPWLAGALTQGIGLWTLLPYVALLAVIQLLLWGRLVRHVTAGSADPATAPRQWPDGRDRARTRGVRSRRR